MSTTVKAKYIHGILEPMEKLNYEEGEEVMVEITKIDHVINFRPITENDPSQAYFWTEEWQKGEKEAEEDLKLGRYKDFDNVEDTIKWLNGSECDEWLKD
ncbi:MAG: antitoxin family protein [Nitrospirae bacterium]|nr:antitoxin family protein [Nitrospirota bacterium]